MIKLFSLSKSEAFVFKLHLVFSVLQGALVGAFALNEYIFIKNINGSNLQLSFLLQSASLVFLFALFVNAFLRNIADKRKMLRLAAVFTHFPLFLFVIFPANLADYQISKLYSFLFIVVFFVFYMNTVVVLPTINQMLKNNYSHHNFGKLYSYSSAINKIVIMLTTLGFGFLLDVNNYAFIFVYPILGLAGIFSVFLLSNIKYSMPFQSKISFNSSVIQSFKSMFVILKTNKPYWHFELGFMFYGFAWMIATVVIPIYYNDVFQMNYASYGFYKNGYNVLAIILLPFFGGLIGRIDPRKFGVITFGSLLLFVVFLLFASFLPQSFTVGKITIYYSLLVAYGFYGVFAATMALLWFIGSAYFCKPSEAAEYQSLHLLLTGFRAVLSFQIGIWLYQWLGFGFTFLIAAISLVVSIIIMFWSYKRQQLLIS